MSERRILQKNSILSKTKLKSVDEKIQFIFNSKFEHYFFECWGIKTYCVVFLKKPNLLNAEKLRN